MGFYEQEWRLDRNKFKTKNNIVRSKIKISVSVLSCNITKYYQVHLPQEIEKGSLGVDFLASSSEPL